MPGELVESLTHFGLFAILAVVGIVLLALTASGTCIGRAMVPKPVTNLV